MVASIGPVASPSQGVSYYERDGYYAKDDPLHREASAWRGRGAEALGLSGAVDPEAFKEVLEGRVPGGPRLGRIDRDGSIQHRPGRDVTFSAPKSVSLVGLVGGDAWAVDAHDRAVKRTLAWVERHAVETRLSDPQTGQMVRARDQKTVVATFRHDTSRNLDPQLHTHAVLANMVQGEDGKWRTMANESLYRRQKLIGMVYRSELAQGLTKLGYAIEKSHADGRFEIAGVSRETIEAYSTRRAEIEAAMAQRGLGKPADNQRLAERAALMTRAHKRDMDKAALVSNWKVQAAELGFEPEKVVGQSREKAAEGPRANRDREPGAELAAAPSREERLAGDKDRGTGQTELQFDEPAADAVDWAASHLAERQAVFSRTDLLTAALAWRPGEVAVEAAERAIGSPRFLDRSPGEVVATLLDEGRYLCSERTMYRFLAAEQPVRERRNQLSHPHYAKPELLATAPNQIWSWDITRLLGPKQWTYFYLYVLLDIFSRYVVGWMVAERENAALAARLIEQSCLKQAIQPQVLTLHSDRGSPMTAKCTAQLLADLGVTRSLGRPQVSDDNPFSEAQFKTLKYHPGFPGRFDDIHAAVAFCRTFFPWYNHEHRHAGIAMLTPRDVHHDRAQRVLEQRQRTLQDAWAHNPERFVHGPPKPQALPKAVWINPPTEAKTSPDAH